MHETSFFEAESGYNVPSQQLYYVQRTMYRESRAASDCMLQAKAAGLGVHQVSELPAGLRNPRGTPVSGFLLEIQPGEVTHSIVRLTWSQMVAKVLPTTSIPWTTIETQILTCVYL